MPIVTTVLAALIAVLALASSALARIHARAGPSCLSQSTVCASESSLMPTKCGTSQFIARLTSQT